MAGPAGASTPDAPGGHVYDRIGRTYTTTRRPDPRIEARLHAPLGRAEPVLNVGAGTGSYEPTDRAVVAVEPSGEMVAQRRPGSAPVARALAGALPFADATFAAALALLTVHHWPDPRAGLAELRRVTTGPVVVFTFDKEAHDPWLIEYLPGMARLDAHHLTAAEIADALGGGTVEVLEVPHDCVDGFCNAWWRRPHAYLDPEVRAGISAIARLEAEEVADGMARLAADLESGAWHRRHADLLDRTSIDGGYRLVVSPGTDPDPAR